MKQIFKTYFLIIMLNITVVGQILFFFGCSKPQVKGMVVDNNNTPIEEVEVKVQGTQFKSTTNANGEYSIEYAPGKVTVLFEKNGYTKNSIMMDISTETEYPSETVRLIKFPDEKEIAEIVDLNKIQTRSIYIDKLLYRFENWNMHPGEDICGSPCRENIELINSYSSLVNEGLIKITDYEFKQPSGFSHNLKKYYVISLTEKGEKYSIGGTYNTKAPCPECWNWIVDSEQYYAIDVKVCDVVFNSIERITNDNDNNTSQIEYTVKTKNTTPWGRFWSVSDEQIINKTVSFSLSSNNEWSYNQW